MEVNIMVKEKDIFNAVKDMVDKYEKNNKGKLTYETKDKFGNLIKKNCTLEAAYAYKIVNAYGDSILNLILIYDGWNDLLQKVATKGIYRGRYDNLDLDIWVYALNINDFELDENSMLLSKNTMIFLDKIGIFSNLNTQDNNDKKLTKKSKICYNISTGGFRYEKK